MYLKAVKNPEYFRDKKIVVYGTGYVAHMFHRILRMHHLEGNIQCCVTTYAAQEAAYFEGIPVYGIHDICMDEDIVVCIAVHEAVRNEIESIVEKITNHYLWVYPYLYEWMLGEPLQRDAEISVENLLEGYKRDLRLAIRLAAIEQQEEKNDYGIRYYIGAQLLHCERETANKRLKQFIGLIEEWKQNGYQKKFPIKINSDCGVIDGDHRVAMAVYMNQKTIYGDVYPSKMAVQEIHECGAMMSGKILIQHGFTERDIEILESIQRRYINRYEKG